ncbi:hypothetical protein WDV93_08290 [Pantoea ananatis]
MGVPPRIFPVYRKGLYEAVKIDKHFFWEHHNSPLWKTTLTQIKDYCQFIIVEGVEKDTYFQFAKTACCGISGLSVRSR